MPKIMSLLLFVLPLAGCLQGPAGSDGSNGTSGSNGRDGQSVVLSSWNGVLFASQEVVEPGVLSYWDIDSSIIRDDRIITVHVRQGAGFMWKEPTWFLASGYVRITDDEKADANWEYKIVVGR